MFITTNHLPKSQGHPFYGALAKVLRDRQFDRFAETKCRQFYAKTGRPSMPPGLYFRCLMVGYFEGISSERGIAWRAADSLSLREFLGIDLDKDAPDHSTISRTRRLIDVETHREIFNWVLTVLADEGLLKGKCIGVDGTTLEANAAMKSIERRDDGRSYPEFLTDLARSSGIVTPTREDLARLDRKRKGRKTSNDDWFNPSDPEAQITKMKDGRTHLAHKQEQAVDMDTGAVVAVNIAGGAEGDTSTLEETVATAEENLEEVRNSSENAKVAERVQEIVADKGYHSNETMGLLTLSMIRSYIAEPARGRRHWKGDDFTQAAVYGNRRRVRGRHGRSLMRRRGELIERSFAHILDTGGMRRTHLRGHQNILKRMLVQVAGFNLGLLMRKLVGVGSPRALQSRLAAALAAFFAFLSLLSRILTGQPTFEPPGRARNRLRLQPVPSHHRHTAIIAIRRFATGC